MTNAKKLLAECAVAVAASFPALAQHPSERSFQLQKGQAIRITPEGKVDVFATMQGGAAYVEKMERRAKLVMKGL